LVQSESLRQLAAMQVPQIVKVRGRARLSGCAVVVRAAIVGEAHETTLRAGGTTFLAKYRSCIQKH